MTRLLAAAVAVMLLLVHRVTAHDPALIVAVIAYTAGSLVLLTAIPRLQASPAAWLADGARGTGTRRRVGGLAQSVLRPHAHRAHPAVDRAAVRRALGWGAGVRARLPRRRVYTELDANTLESTIRLETIATHLMVPLVVVLALAYATDVLERLRDERLRSERLAVESERQRIAWELHDSAKQRVHAAHLVLSALQGQVEGAQAQLVGHALAELRAAGADMDTSVAELRTPLEGRSVQRLLEERAAELAPASDAQISVRGTIGELPAHVAAHAYRIAAEALTNAVRHGDAEHVDVVLARNGASATIEVRDDGRGLPTIRRPGSNGLRSMRARADTIGATLSLGPGDGGTRDERRTVLLDRSRHIGSSKP